jgi:hypothetical protein
MAQANTNIVPISDYTALSALSPQQLDVQLAQREQHFVDAAQQAAPLSYQIQLAREISIIRMIRMVGQGAVMETATLTERVMQEMAQTGLFAQVIIDGLRGKVPDAVVDKLAEVQGAFLEGAALIHAVTTGAIFDRAQQFKAPSSEVRFRDVVYSVAFDKVSRRLTDRGR